MRFVFLFTILIFSGQVSAQSLEEKIVNELCICFETSDTYTDSESFLDEFINTCFEATFLKLKDEFEQTYDPNGEFDYEEGYRMGYELAPQILNQLILTCDKFYIFFDSLRWDWLKNHDKKGLRKDLDSLNSEINKGRGDSKAYFLRGLTLFNLNKVKKSKKDFHNAIKLDSKFGPPYFFMGIIDELNEDYPEAKSNYEKCYELTGEQKFTLFISLVERKLR